MKNIFIEGIMVFLDVGVFGAVAVWKAEEVVNLIS